MRFYLRLLVVGVLLLSLPGSLFARGVSGGGGRSSSGGSSSRSSGSSWGSGSSSSPSRSSSGGSSWGSGSSTSPSRSTSSPSSSGSGWGTSSRFSGSDTSPSTGFSGTNTRSSGSSGSSTDRSLARKTGQSGPQFSNRSDAVKDFQQKHAAEYTSTFRTEPTTRPTYIPQTVIVNNHNYPVYYDNRYGGYGYWAGSTWTAYDVMRDAIVLDTLLNRNNYSYSDPYYRPTYNSGPTYSGGGSRSGSGGFFSGLLTLLFLIFIIWIISRLFFSKPKSPEVNQATPADPAQADASGVDKANLNRMDKTNPADWFKIKPQSIITLTDAQAIQDSMRRNLGVHGIDYTVKSVATMKHLQGLSTHLLFTLADPEQTVYLVVKIVDQELDPYIYFEVPGLASGSRQELIDRGLLWLFQEPANPQNFDPADLRYSTTLRQTLPKDGGGEIVVNYTLKSQGELQCSYQETPARTGISGDLLATVAEYRTDQQVENPEFLLLEVGSQQSTDSFVQFFLGCPAKLAEIDILGI